MIFWNIKTSELYFFFFGTLLILWSSLEQQKWILWNRCDRFATFYWTFSHPQRQYRAISPTGNRTSSVTEQPIRVLWKKRYFHNRRVQPCAGACGSGLVWWVPNGRADIPVSPPKFRGTSVALPLYLTAPDSPICIPGQAMKLFIAFMALRLFTGKCLAVKILRKYDRHVFSYSID